MQMFQESLQIKDIRLSFDHQQSYTVSGFPRNGSLDYVAFTVNDVYTGTLHAYEQNVHTGTRTTSLKMQTNLILPNQFTRLYTQWQRIRYTMR